MPAKVRTANLTTEKVLLEYLREALKTITAESRPTRSNLRTLLVRTSLDRSTLHSFQSRRDRYDFSIAWTSVDNLKTNKARKLKRQEMLGSNDADTWTRASSLPV